MSTSRALVQLSARRAVEKPDRARQVIAWLARRPGQVAR